MAAWPAQFLKVINLIQQSMQRRQLIAVLKLLFITGGVLLLLPMLLSTGMFRATSSGDSGLVVKVSDIPPGDYRQIDYAGRELWVYRWTVQEQSTYQVDDPRQAWSVLIPYEPYRQCRVHLQENSQGNIRFVEPCFRAGFDITGRRIRETGVDEQGDLPRLPFQWQNEREMIIQPGKRIP